MKITAPSRKKKNSILAKYRNVATMTLSRGTRYDDGGWQAQMPSLSKA